MPVPTLLIIFIILSVIFFVTTVLFVVLYALKPKMAYTTSAWEVKLSGCQENNVDIGCGEGVEHAIFACPGNNCGPEPEQVSQPCIVTSGCEWTTTPYVSTSKPQELQSDRELDEPSTNE